MQVWDAGTEARGAWEAFVLREKTGSFLQSWEWGAFQEAAGFRVRRHVVSDDAAAGSIHGVCLCVERPLPLGQRYLYAPWGPVVSGGDVARARELFQLFRQAVIHDEHRLPVYVRIEPRLADDSPHEAALEETGFILLRRGVQPQDTLLLDLTMSEDDLLKQMQPKTRYNIRLASRHGVSVEERTTVQGVATFLALAHEVQKRGHFRYHPDAYYETMFRTLARSGMFHLLVAVHKGLTLAAALLIRYGTTVTYAHGASSGKRPHVMASYLLHWEAIKWAQRQGAETYDFFGVAPPAGGGVAHHPWTGVSRFKRGFGGREAHYLGIADAVLDPLRYRLYMLGRGFRGLLH